MNTVCKSARDHLSKIQAVNSRDSGRHDIFLRFLLKLHDCASTVGFLSLASATAAYHDSIVNGAEPDKFAICRSLEAELRRAEAEWEASRPSDGSCSAAPFQGTRGQGGKMSCELEMEDMQGSTAPELRAAVVRHYLSRR